MNDTGLTIAQRFRTYAALQPDGVDIHLSRDDALYLARVIENNADVHKAIDLMLSAKASYLAASQRIDRHEHWLYKYIAMMTALVLLAAWAGWI